MAEAAQPYPDGSWLATMLPLVQAQLPSPPARVLEIGCGQLGGFVPALLAQGYDATGIDPSAPEGAAYAQVEFGQYVATEPIDAVVASVSLHHVHDLEAALDHVHAALTPSGVVAVVEWAHEDFDEATARWCFARLPRSADGSWLHEHRDRWLESSQSWHGYLQSWAEHEGLHTGARVIKALESRFDTSGLDQGPYFFPDLEATADDERAAIAAGLIRATCVQYVGRRRPASGS